MGMCIFYVVACDSNSDNIFIAPNLHPRTDSTRTKQKQETIIIILRHTNDRHAERKTRERKKLGWVCLCEEIGLELCSERMERNGRMHDVIRQIIPNLWSIISKAVAKYA